MASITARNGHCALREKPVEQGRARVPDMDLRRRRGETDAMFMRAGLNDASALGKLANGQRFGRIQPAGVSFRNGNRHHQTTRRRNRVPSQGSGWIRQIDQITCEPRPTVASTLADTTGADRAEISGRRFPAAAPNSGHRPLDTRQRHEAALHCAVDPSTRQAAPTAGHEGSSDARESVDELATSSVKQRSPLR